MYGNVTQRLHALSVMYLILNITLLILLILNSVLRVKKGFFYYIKNLYSWVVVPYYVAMGYLVYYRFMFTTQVCLCGFMDSYFLLRKMWYDASPS